MKKCPHCDRLFAETKKVCPQCGTPYWKPEDDKEFNQIYKDPDQEEKDGCLSLLFMPVTVSLLITAFLVFSGFILNLLIHFENSQIKFIWLILSVLVGLLAYKLFTKKRTKNTKSTKEFKE